MLADGRLPSAGTRTIKLRGRGTITFHVFDPTMVRHLLEQDAIQIWREEDAERKRAAASRPKLRPSIVKPISPATLDEDPERFELRGWAELEKDGPL